MGRLFEKMLTLSGYQVGFWSNMTGIERLILLPMPECDC